MPLSAFCKNIPGKQYEELPPSPPSIGEVVYLLWFSTGDLDRGMVIDRIWVDRRQEP